MTTRDTVEDIMRVLREQPDVLAEIRRIILTDELLALPAQFAEMQNTQAAMQKTQAQMLEVQNDHSAQFIQIRGEIHGIVQTQNEHSKILETHTSEIAELKNDVGILKGLAAFAPAERRYGLIALEMGLEPEDLLTPVEIARLCATGAEHGLDQSAIQSFIDSDLIISARASDGRLNYIAVKVSYTVGHSDIDRAIAHAEIITLLTGAPAFAAVSGAQAAPVAIARLHSDSIHWHQLPRKILEPR